MPDVLVMTATPIPRTLALTVYGDLDVSVIRDMPPGRRADPTTVKPESRRDEVYELVRTAARGGPAGLRRLSADRGVGEGRSQGGDGDGGPRSRRTSFPEYRVALLHGRMKQDAKDRVMRAFAGGRDPRAGLDHGHRGRHRRAQRHA